MRPPFYQGISPVTALHPVFDWHEVARLALASRMMDEMEEQELVPAGKVTYQFSARGHELGQLLLSQLLTRPFDTASAYYRSRPFMLGSGLTLEEAFASDMARAGSINAGRDVGVVFNLPRRERAMVMPAAADVGSQYTASAGFAQALQYRARQLGEAEASDSIVVVFGGDGSVASNGFWSALTMATTLKLPLLFVIEDNGYAISVRHQLQTPGGDIAQNLASFTNLRIWNGSGVQPQETAELVLTAVEYMREWAGPGLLRLTVPRLSGHSSVDNQAYKSETTVQEEWSRDPIPALHHYLVPALMDEGEWEQLIGDVKEEVCQARDAALAQPLPDPHGVTHFIFADPQHPQKVGGLLAEGIQLPQGTPTPHPADMSRINMIEAIRRTLDSEMAVNPRLVLFGEDVGIKGGVHAATVGLQAKHGEARVFDTSLSEEGIVGRAVGMALAGLMPVPEIQFRKYLDPATEHVNNCGSIRWRSNNRFAAPLVLRLPGGFRKIGDPWHSVTSEGVLAHQIGWQVAVPSNAEDTVGLLRAALRGNDPVIFFEHRYLLDAAWARRPYPGDDFVLPFGQARIASEGTDLTVITWGAMVERCELAARELNASIEIIDLRTLAPWDKAGALASIRKTGKCLIVHDDVEFMGFGAEIAAVIAAEGFAYLDGPVERLGAPSTLVPFNTGLMDAVIPNVATIKTRMESLLAF
jgi:2-oxoisovalerate dehydrogenase E1 component